MSLFHYYNNMDIEESVNYVLSRVVSSTDPHPIAGDYCWHFIPKNLPTTQINIEGKIIRIPRLLYSYMITDELSYKIQNGCGDDVCVNPFHYSKEHGVLFGKDKQYYKKCSKCGEYKLFNNDFFTVDRRRKLGFKPYCKDCGLEANRLDAENNWDRFLFYNAKTSSKDRNLEFNLTREFISELYKKQHGKCFWLGIPMSPSSKPKELFQPSIDRIDRNKGYTKDNIVLASFLANFGRNDSSVSDWTKALKILKESLDFSFWNKLDE